MTQKKGFMEDLDKEKYKGVKRFGIPIFKEEINDKTFFSKTFY